MKIISILELAKLYGTQAVGMDGEPIYDENGEPQYVLKSPQSPYTVLEGKDTDEIKRMTAANSVRNFGIKALLLSDGNYIDDVLWSEFTYEEIIDLYNDGVEVPDDVLQQAYKMLNDDEMTNETDTDDELSNVSDNTPSSNDTNGSNWSDYKKQVVNALYNQQKAHDEFVSEMEDIELFEAELNKLEAENEQNSISTKFELEKTEKEWNTLKNKADRGEELTFVENKKLEELAQDFKNLNEDIENIFGRNAGKIEDINSAINVKKEFADKSIFASQKAIDTANSLDAFANGSKEYGLAKTNGETNLLKILKYDSSNVNLNAESLAQEAILESTNSLNYANENSVQIEEIISKAQAQSQIPESLEVPETIETLAKNVSEADTESEEDVKNSEIQQVEENTEGQDLNLEEEVEPVQGNINTISTVEDTEEVEEVNNENAETEEVEPNQGEQGAEVSELDMLEQDGNDAEDLALVVKAEGIDSEKEGRDAMANILELDTKAADLMYGKSENELEDVAIPQVEEAGEVASTSGVQLTTEDNVEETVNEAGAKTDGENQSITTSELTASIASGIKAIDDEKLSVVEKLEKIKDKNDNYAQTISPAMNIMEEVQDKGADALEKGLLQIAAGLTMAASGTAMLAYSFFNPLIVAIALKLIEKGKEFYDLGSQYAQIGNSLIKITKDGKEDVEEADKQISTTGAILTLAIKKAKEDEASDNNGDSNSKGGASNGEKDAESVKNDSKNQSKGISGITKSAKEDSEDSKKAKKDSEKDEKELRQEAKAIQKEMLTTRIEANKLNKQSEQAAREQDILLAQYEQVVTESEQLVAEAETKQANGSMQAQPQAVQGASGQANAPQPATVDISGEQAQLDENRVTMDTLDRRFKYDENLIKNNSTRLKLLERTTKASQKRFESVTKAIEKKVADAEKKELEKQKKLEQELAIVGVATDVFSVTMATGSIMMLIPYTAAAGAIIFKIGLAGVIACGIADGTIEIANGNVEAGLMAFGKTAVTAAASLVGAGGAANTALTAISNGASIVSNSANMVNDVRTIEGKEKSEAASVVSTSAGIASSLASVGASMSDFKAGDVVDKGLKIASAVGAVTTATGQVMNMVDSGNETAQTLMMIGGYISSAAAIGTLAKTSYNNLSEKRQQVDEALPPKNESGEPPANQPTQKPSTDNNNNENTNNNEQYEERSWYGDYNEQIIEPEIQNEVVELEVKQAEAQNNQEKASLEMQKLKETTADDVIEGIDKILAKSNEDIQTLPQDNALKPADKVAEEKSNKSDKSWVEDGLKLVGDGLKVASAFVGNEEKTQFNGIEKTPFDYEMSAQAREIIAKAKKRINNMQKLQYRINTMTV